jgi:hypothetical protein
MIARYRRRKLKFIGCEIIYREACFLAAVSPARVDVEFLRKGLHDQERSDMLSRIQGAIDAVDPAEGYEAILLGYARCNDGLAGAAARGIPLVIPRAHDCITFFFGSRGAYRDYFDSHPGTYYMSTGWAERNIGEDGDYARPAYGLEGVMGKLGLAQSFEEMVEKYGRENAEYIASTMGDWLKNYNKFLYMPMGIGEEEDLIEDTRKAAGDRNWEFEVRQGDLSLLRKLFWGQWDDDFVIVPPGGRIVARNDERVLDAIT